MRHACRRASLEDLSALAPLFDGYRCFYQQASDPSRAERFLRERLEAQDTVLFLAEDEAGEADAFCHLFPLWSSVRTGRLWLLNDLYVAPRARRQGVGRLLMEHAIAFARGDGAVGLSLETAKDNHPAAALYRELGFHLDQDFHHFELPLP